MDNIMIISSDGHAAAQMRDYREYLDPEWREEFDRFCDIYDERATGKHSAVGSALKMFIDADVADQWDLDYVDNGRVEGLWDPARRLQELESEGICGEVLIPDFGLPFRLYPPAVRRALNWPAPSPAELAAGDRAFNRWLSAFCASAPERYAGMAHVKFDPVEDALTEIRKAKQLGLKGVMVPTFDAEEPLFLPKFDPIWSLLEELDLPATSHASVSLTSDFMFDLTGVPHPGCAGPLGRSMSLVFCHQILDHLVWGGVFERHPKLRVVFTEQGSGWLPSKLRQMDYSYDGSYMRQDLKSVIRHKPSEYFARQCWIGSSLLARSEVENRALIGVDKMMVGSDYPHFEGTWNGGNLDYLQAAFGPAQVSESEARLMLGENIARVYDFDKTKLQAIANRIGPPPERILTPPSDNKFPRGDVGKPLGSFSL